MLSNPPERDAIFLFKTAAKGGSGAEGSMGGEEGKGWVRGWGLAV